MRFSSDPELYKPRRDALIYGIICGEGSLGHAGNCKILRNCSQDVLQAERTRSCAYHAVYGETVGVFDIASMEMTEGDLPPNAQRLVKDWLPKHQDELAEMWRTQKIVELPPLD